jgi:CCR4-NOT complex subunit CAF16
MPRTSLQGITYLGPEWVQNPVTKRDVPVSTLLESHQALNYPDRLCALLELLEIDPSWHTHQISDGQRRRVQILLGLIKPFQVLLCDEVTVDLDILVRKDLLKFLRRECETRKCTVVCFLVCNSFKMWKKHFQYFGRINLVMSTS